jgi:hypothetical protein
VSDLQKIAHSIQDASSAAVKDRNDQISVKAIVNARNRQENEDFEMVVGLRNGHIVAVDDDDVTVVDGDGCDLLSGSKETARRPNAFSLGAQTTASDNVASRATKRVLLEQRIAKSAAKDPDGDRWFGPGEKPKKGRHQDAQERMDSLMDGMMGEGSLMIEAIKDLIPGRAADNPTTMTEKEFGLLSENMKKLLDVKAKLVALSMDTSSIDVLIQKKLDELATH